MMVYDIELIDIDMSTRDFEGDEVPTEEEIVEIEPIQDEKPAEEILKEVEE